MVGVPIVNFLSTSESGLGTACIKQPTHLHQPLLSAFVKGPITLSGYLLNNILDHFLTIKALGCPKIWFMSKQDCVVVR